jgi:biotin carboxyl carrier protein
VADITEQEGRYLVEVGGERYEVLVEEEARYRIRTRAQAGGGRGTRWLTAPLPGRVTHVAVRVGDQVRAGDPLLVIEAMKMENEFRAGGPGVVTEVRVAPGQAVNAGDVLVVIDTAGP